ncbi:MAG: hypothetical protein JO128_18940, partial [Alphaproteobacteria bacterium]|nr:hypothetical protein [Alphaproteobacteria bacterium]
MGSNIAAAELTGLVAATFFMVYWLRGGRPWLLPAGIGHLFVALLYVYLLVSPVGIPPPRADWNWFELTLPLCLVAANAFLFFGLLQLLERAPAVRIWAASWTGVALAVVVVQVIAGPVLAFCVAVASSVAVNPVIAFLLMARRTLFYVIAGVLLFARVVFQVVATYFGAFHVLPALVDLLVYVNLAAVVGDGFGLLLIEYDDTRRQLADADRAKSVFLSSVSHELRTPLNAIIGFADLISDQPYGEIDKRYRAYALDILESGRKLLSVVNQILDLTDIEAKRFRLDPQRLDLVDVARDALSAVQPRAELRGIRLHTAFPDAAVAAVGDRRALTQVVASLIDNAIKYTQPGGRVDVDVSVVASPRRAARVVV